MSLGSALFEEMVFDNGQPINSTFLEYMPPSMEDHPDKFQSLLVETPHPEGPYGAKGVGEAGPRSDRAGHRQRGGERIEAEYDLRICRYGRIDFGGGSV